MRLTRLTASVALLAALGPAAVPAGAQTLQGSRASIDRMYRQAQAHDLYFYRTGTGVRNAARDGDLVRLGGNEDYRLAGVSYPYVLPMTRTFVQRLAAQYRGHCGERLVVTSAARPRSLRLANSTDRSVHPTGMAVDIRRPTSTRCLRWLRETLAYLERRGVLEATEERRPPHFHVAVYPGPYRRYVGGGATDGRRTAQRSTSGDTTTYRVRRGDSLWTIARRHGTTVDRLKRLNDVRGNRIIAGQVLVVPAR